MAQDLLAQWNQDRVKRVVQSWLLPLLGVLLAAICSCPPPGSGQLLAASAPATAESPPTPTRAMPTALPPQASPTPLPRPYHDPPAPPALQLSQTQATPLSSDQQQHPRIVKLWGGYDPAVGLGFYAQYDLLISQAFTDRQLDALRSRNPAMRVLYTGQGTYDVDDGPLGRAWISAAPNTPEYNCFYRGTDGRVLKVAFWDHGMFNLGDAWCRQAIVDHTLAQVALKIPQLYDGLFFDRIHQAITPILPGIDLDHDGHVDDAALVDHQHENGIKAFLDTLRQELGEDLLLIANDAPLAYASRLNGREYESTLRGILDHDASWDDFRYNYEQWMQASREPRLTMLMANPPKWIEEKYQRQPWLRMRGAVLDEAAAHYQRMRFGLTSALLEGGLYGFELGTTWHGNAWWYDEFDNAGTHHGYLGAPLGEAYRAAGPLTTANRLQNPGFESDLLAPWTLHVDSTYAEAEIERVRVHDLFTSTHAARVTITARSHIRDVRLEQSPLTVTAHEHLNLSFWAKASTPLWEVHLRLRDSRQPDTTYAGPEPVKLGPTWQRLDVPLSATESVTDAVLSFDLGRHTGTVWIDEVSLQQGTLSAVYRRDFQRGIVLCNPALTPQTVQLGGEYCKIQGLQAPRNKIIVDDSEQSTSSFVKLGGWAGHGKGDQHYDDCWGATYHHALTTQDPGRASSSVTWRPDIPFHGAYTISAWALPCALCTQPVTYTIAHAAGTTSVSVDVLVEQPSWIDLGVYPLKAGMGTSVTLTNQSHSEWVIADAVKFESVTRYNDGTCSRSITLDAQDGIILLHGSHHAYLPLILQDQRTVAGR